LSKNLYFLKSKRKMPKPKTKVELLETSQQNFKKMMELIDSFSEKEQLTEFPQGSMNRNIRDVLAHVHHWNLLLLEWYQVGMSGKKPDMPAKGYTWKTTPDLNRHIFEKYQKTKLSKARAMLENSYSELLAMIQRHSNEELFEKKRYKWTGSTSLGAYLTSNASSHYVWAYKLIKKMKK